MVQGTALGQSTSLNIKEYDKTAKKSGYEAIQKIQQQGNKNSNENNPWGTTFKNKDNFRNMHIC